MLRGLLLWFILIAGLPIAFLRPFAGLLLYLWYSHARPNDFVCCGYSSAMGATLLSGATLLGYVLFEIHRSPPVIKGLRLISLFWLWIALATMSAAVPSLAQWKLSQYTHIFVITFLVAAMANSQERLRTLFYVMGGSLGLMGAKGAIDFITSGGHSRMRGPGGLAGEENEYALVLNMAIPILFGLSQLEDRRWLRLVMRGMAVGCAVTVIGTRSRSGFLGLIAVGLLLTFYSKRRLLGIAGLVLASVLLLKFAPPEAMRRYESISTAAETDNSAIGRLQAWETGLAMIKAHPFFGVGPFNFFDTFSQYSNYEPRAPHNAFVALAAESGIPSCVLFVAILLSTIGRMWLLRRRLKKNPANEALAAYCLIIQTTLLVYIVPNFFINRQNLDLMYHLVGLSAGLALVAHRRLVEQQLDTNESLQEEAGLAFQPVGI
jgi:putative inorganic carbon (HCO3(-)) transporter